MEKLNPQPEPPIGFDIIGWLVYPFRLLIWFIQMLFQPTMG